MVNQQKIEKRASWFTLIELLIVISIMVIIAGIGVKGYKRMSGEMALYLSETQVKKIVSATILEAKRNRIPMQIQVYVPDNPNTKSCIVRGGSGALIGYWDFDGDTAETGLRKLTLNPAIDKAGGYFGKGASFENKKVYSLNQATALFSFNNNVYMEVMVRPDIESIFATTGPNNEIDVLNGGNGKFKLVLKNIGDYGLKVKAIVTNGGSKLEVESDKFFPDDGQWHKIGISTMGGDDKTVSVYIDNVLSNSKTQGFATASAIATEHFSIGHNNFWGIMDDVKVYNLGSGQEASLDPKDTFIVGQTSNTTRYINVSPYGTIDENLVIQIASTRMIGRLEQTPNVNTTPVDYIIQRVRSSIPKSGYITFDGGMAQYTWGGSETLKILDDEMFGTKKPSTNSFQVIKPIIIRKDGVIQ